ncbi:MAG TPA: cyclodeaminase/cyclohydrolase family protein [Streptosporangiaceae bacterium]|nr:cyclodeaminase/cyclohydrolase family protein [Streptosporangiaceae bacterium]
MQNDLEANEPASAQTIGAWLDALASAAPTPGGGGAAALSVSVGAALVEMVCNLTIGKPAFGEHEQHARAVRDAARELRVGALGLLDADAAAFGELMATYRLPKDSDEQREYRLAAIRTATVRAASVPLEIAATGAEVARLAAELPGRTNPNVLSDVGVAASSAAAAIESAAINVEINLVSLKDDGERAPLAGRLAAYLATAGQARQLVTDVRGEIGR